MIGGAQMDSVTYLELKADSNHFAGEVEFYQLGAPSVKVIVFLLWVPRSSQSALMRIETCGQSKPRLVDGDKLRHREVQICH